MQKKFNYNTPMVKVVAFQVEEGFQTSRLKVGNPTLEADFGTQELTDQGTWTGTYINN